MSWYCCINDKIYHYPPSPRAATSVANIIGFFPVLNSWSLSTHWFYYNQMQSKEWWQYLNYFERLTAMTQSLSFWPLSPWIARAGQPSILSFLVTCASPKPCIICFATCSYNTSTPSWYEAKTGYFSQQLLSAFIHLAGDLFISRQNSEHLKEAKQ